MDASLRTEMQLKDERHDLLDRLVMEDQDEKTRRLRQHHMQYEGNIIEQQQTLSIMEMENLLKLLEIQQASIPAPEDRACSRFQSYRMGMAQGNNKPFYCNSFEPTNSILINQMRKKNRSPDNNDVTTTLGCSSSISFKDPRPHHTSAFSASVNLANLQTSTTSPLIGSPLAVQLRVQEARWQFQALETDRKRTEAAIAKQNPGMRISSSNTIQIPRLPLNPTKLDKLLVDSLREQARVLTLLQRIEASSSISGTSEFACFLAMWKEKILVVMEIRRKERMSTVGMGDQLGESLASMSLASRKARY